MKKRNHKINSKLEDAIVCFDPQFELYWKLPAISDSQETVVLYVLTWIKNHTCIFKLILDATKIKNAT